MTSNIAQKIIGAHFVRAYLVAGAPVALRIDQTLTHDAAVAPRFLGVRSAVAKSFLRIDRQNLIDYGVLPLRFVGRTDYEPTLATTMSRGPTIAGMSANIRPCETPAIACNCVMGGGPISRRCGSLASCETRRTPTSCLSALHRRFVDDCSVYCLLGDPAVPA